MSRRTTGVSLLAISAFLYATRFIAAAIWGTGFTSWSNENFSHLLGYVDQGLTLWSIVALAAGVVYLLWAETGRKEGADWAFALELGLRFISLPLPSAPQ